MVRERPETGPATARKPFDHLAHAVGSGKRLIDLALLMRFLDRHFACRKCAETDTHTQLRGFAKWYDVRRTTYDVRRTTYDVRRTPRGWRRATPSASPRA